MNPAISINSEIKRAADSAGLRTGSCSENFSISSLAEVGSIKTTEAIKSAILSIPINIHFFCKKIQNRIKKNNFVSPKQGEKYE